MLVIVNRTEQNINVEVTQDYKNGKVIFEVNSSKDIISKYGILIIVS